VIIALHHEQECARWRSVEGNAITYLVHVIGAMANAVCRRSRILSKDSIIERPKLSHTSAGFAWLMSSPGVRRGFYSFRLVFYAFHARRGRCARSRAHESPRWSRCAGAARYPSVISGWVIGEVVFGGYFGGSIYIAETHPGVKEMAEEFHELFP